MYAEGSRGGGEKHTVEAQAEQRDRAAAVKAVWDPQLNRITW